jgi:TolA-binding protein
VTGVAILQAGAFFLLARRLRAETRRKPPAEARAEQREERLTELYGHIEELMDVFESYVEEVRQDFERERAALAELSRQAAALYARGPETAAAPVPTAEPVAVPPAAPGGAQPAPAPAASGGVNAPVIRPAAFPAFDAEAEKGRKTEPPSRLSGRDKAALGRFATKPQKVRFLMSRGLALDEVARELGIGWGEVRLIAELEK